MLVYAAVVVLVEKAFAVLGVFLDFVDVGQVFFEFNGEFADGFFCV